MRIIPISWLPPLKKTGPSHLNRSIDERKQTHVYWRLLNRKLMDNRTNTRIKRGENFLKTKDFPLGES